MHQRALNWSLTSFIPRELPALLPTSQLPALLAFPPCLSAPSQAHCGSHLCSHLLLPCGFLWTLGSTVPLFFPTSLPNGIQALAMFLWVVLSYCRRLAHQQDHQAAAQAPWPSGSAQTYQSSLLSTHSQDPGTDLLTLISFGCPCSSWDSLGCGQKYSWSFSHQ